MSRPLVYPIVEEKEEGRCLCIKAGNHWVDEKRQKRFEGFILFLPKEIRDRNIEFDVTAIQQTKDFDIYEISLYNRGEYEITETIKGYPVHPKAKCFIDAGGEFTAIAAVHKDVIKKWTGLDGRHIENAFGSIKLGDTFKLMLFLPTKITLIDNEIEITKSKVKKIEYNSYFHKAQKHLES